MPPSPTYLLFKKTNCVLLQVYSEIALGPSAVSRLRECLAGKRRNLPYWFAATYDGEGKQRIGLSAAVDRIKKGLYSLSMRWFETEFDPPAGFAKFSELVDCLDKVLAEREAQAMVIFSFRKDQRQSLFKPIVMADQPAIFDEIVGFTGIKRDAKGKVLYEMDISIGAKQIEHRIRFSQTVKLTQDLPLALIETASKISTLALRAKGAT